MTTDDGVRARRRPPPELLVAVVLGYLSGIAKVLDGIVLMFARYLPDMSDEERFVITLTGACTVLLGLFIVATASGLTRARRDARLLVTMLLGVAVLFDVITLVAAPEQWFVIADLLLSIAALTVLWTGRSARFFARTAGAPPA